MQLMLSKDNTKSKIPPKGNKLFSPTVEARAKQLWMAFAVVL
jgi:hypothetical protein